MELMTESDTIKTLDAYVLLNKRGADTDKIIADVIARLEKAGDREAVAVIRWLRHKAK